MMGVATEGHGSRLGRLLGLWCKSAVVQGTNKDKQSSENVKRISGACCYRISPLETRLQKVWG